MDIFSLFVLAISLSLDTLSVGTAQGLHFHQHRLRNGLKLAFTFGLFHLSMPILGGVIGQSLRIFVSQIEISIFLAGVIMGSVAFCLTMIGFMTGNKIGKMFSEKAELVGGIILIGLGIKILIEHLNGG